MALRATELRLIVSFQNQGAGALTRMSRDLRGLTHQANLSRRALLATERAGRKEAELGRQLSRLQDMRFGPGAIQRQKALVDARRRMAMLERQGVTLTQQRERRERGLTRVMQQQADIERQLRKATRVRAALRTPAQLERIDTLRMARAGLRDRAIDLERQLGLLQMRERELSMAVESASLNLEKQSASTARNAQRQAELRQQIRNNIAVLRRYRMEIAETNRAAAIARADRMMGIGRGIGHAARTAQLAGMLGTAGAGFAAEQFAQLQTSTTLAATQTRKPGQDFRVTAQNADELYKSIRRLKMEFPASAEEMSKAAYDIYSSMDVNFNQGIALLAQFNKAAVAGQVDLGTATNAMITIMNNFDPSLKNVAGDLNQVFSIVKYGRMNFQQFSTMLNKVVPAAKGAEQSLGDVGGAMAFLTTRMPSQRQAATGLSRFLEMLTNPEVVQGLKKYGVEVRDAAGKTRPMLDILKDVATNPNFKGITSGGPMAQNFFQVLTAGARGGGPGTRSTQNARQAFVFMITQMQEYEKMQNVVTENTDEFTQAYTAMNQTLGVRWEIMKSQLQVLILTIGEQAIPIFINFAGYIKQIVDWFQSLGDGLDKQVIKWTIIGSLIALVGGAVMSLIAPIVSFIGMLMLLSANLGGAAEGASLLGRLGLLVTMLARLSMIGTIVISLVLLAKKYPHPSDIFGIDPDSTVGRILNYKVSAKDAAGAAKRIVNYLPSKLPFLKDMPGIKKVVKTVPDIMDASTRAKMPTKKIPEWMKALDMFAESPEIKARLAKQNSALAKAYQDFLKALHGKNADAADKAAAQIKKDNLRVERAMDAAGKAMQDKINQMAENLANKWSEIRDQNARAFGGLFQGPWLTGPQITTDKEWGIMPTMEDLNKDLRQQLGQFSKWRNQLAKLTQRGVPPELIKQLQEMGPDAIDNVNLIANASPKAFNEFVGNWKKSQKAIDDATKIDFSAQLKQWKSYGQNIAKQIIEGLRSENPKMEAYFRKMINDMFPGLVAQARAGAGAKERAEIARERAAKNAKAKTKTSGAATATTSPTGLQNNPRTSLPEHEARTVVHQTIHATQEPNLVNQLQRAKWHYEKVSGR